jgi:flagellar export protein FliJ
MNSLYTNVKQLEEEISVFQSYIHKKFVEFKVFEIAKEKKTKEILLEQQKKIQQNLDEIAINNFITKSIDTE